MNDSHDTSDASAANSQVPLAPPRFLVEGELADLTKMLRCLGFDCAYSGGMSLPDAIVYAVRDGRVLITRKPVPQTTRLQVFRVNRDDSASELQRLDHAYSLGAAASPFSRCLKCNQILEWAGAQGEHLRAVPERVRARTSDFFRCPQCRRLYWHGTHVDRMLQRLAEAGFASVRWPSTLPN